MQQPSIGKKTIFISKHVASQVTWICRLPQLSKCPVFWYCLIFFYEFAEINDTVVDGIHRPVIYGIGEWWICFKDGMFLLHMTTNVKCLWLLLYRGKCQNRWSLSFIIYSQRTCRGAAIYKDFHWREGAVILKSTCFESTFYRDSVHILIYSECHKRIIMLHQFQITFHNRTIQLLAPMRVAASLAAPCVFLHFFCFPFPSPLLLFLVFCWKRVFFPMDMDPAARFKRLFICSCEFLLEVFKVSIYLSIYNLIFQAH